MNGTVTNEEMRHLIDSIDPNADAARISGLITYWYGYSDLSRGESPNGYSDTYVEKFQKIDSALTNEGNKKNLYSILANQMLIIFPMNEEEINNFVGKIEPQIKNAPSVRAIFTDAINKLNSQIKDGDELPSNPILVDIDGNKTSLLDCIGGKVAYIDLWATWCAPCCKEIPNMEKVAERFAGNDKIVFISISQDDDVEQWKNKVIADNPSWPNFIFSQPSGKEFLEAINCYSIPRFLIIGSNGRFVAVNAPRPSSENIDSVLNEAIETK